MYSANNQRILVVDDHESVLYATINVLKKHYPQAETIQAQSIESALKQLENVKFDLIIVDLAMPEIIGGTAEIDNGIQLLKTLMRQDPSLNIVVQTANTRALVRLKAAISNHEGGFTVADKSLPMSEMLTKVDWALKGLHNTPVEIRSGLELKPEWLKVLQLAFKEGLMDKPISKQMNISERTVRHYWTKIYDVLRIYPDEGKNLRIQAEIRAREEGLID
ncbi:response regulator receiver protein [Nostoc linckia z18]|jgi:DNA-binding NarL/FixJ family response regulator|uniref:Response regulator receiver protein n=2 Tax=Nostoc linckia TaxID=92942 RepID=A0A9Q5ZDN5_NOSLI|nr:response regulator transcription factor [Nostoc linckia]MBL1198682.1 response regulator transcription factor [Nostoc sp. GBBB01]MDZ8013930.1 response regulator transcription factor [Nostoc sp. ZfuVER08]PHK34275.1 response regulator receiver protein [Nostoc linckia z15]PHK46850.1 response regulator receiver protein [Nostoc linckia z16]PHJ61284.1 response regulator receiver protein [Nostoc linckia z1]